MAGPALTLTVLASGSAGNCALLRIGTGVTTRAVLIDAGLSPRRTRRLLAERGIRPDQVDDILVTHFDRDHFHLGWANADLTHTRVRFHHAHGTPARNAMRSSSRLAPFSDRVTLSSGLQVTPVRLAHDDEGVTAFRIDGEDASLGYATDLGRPTAELMRRLAGVGTLAIESNYCPELQVASDRPAFLKQRIMGGRGHLSNQEAADAAHAIDPLGRLVLLHLSQQCNTPERARLAHARAAVPVIVTSQIDPTDPIPVGPPRPPAQRGLFDHAHPQSTTA
ncbi:MAG: MBL fold metallo-hydrolase [Phycisphaerales bacterium]